MEFHILPTAENRDIALFGGRRLCGAFPSGWPPPLLCLLPWERLPLGTIATLFEDLFRRLRRHLVRYLSDGDAGGGFFLDFTSRAAAQSIFEEGSGGLYTDGTRACMEASESHLAYGVPISGGEAGEVGLRLVMDNQDVYCGHSAELAVGHLAGWKYLTYGDFEWRARIHHSPDGSAPPPNSFTCFSTYVHGGKTHNEIAWCFPPTSGHEVHMSYWYDDRMHQTVRKVSVDLTQAIHKYTVRWREVGIDFLIDDVILHKVRGTAGVDVPWEPMSMRIILRPKNIPSMYLGTSVVEVAHVAYDPAYSVASDSVSYSSPTAATPSWATSSGTDTGDADAATPTSSHLQRSSPLPPPPHSPSPPPPRLRTTPFIVRLSPASPPPSPLPTPPPPPPTPPLLSPTAAMVPTPVDHVLSSSPPPPPAPHLWSPHLPPAPMGSIGGAAVGSTVVMVADGSSLAASPLSDAEPFLRATLEPLAQLDATSLALATAGLIAGCFACVCLIAACCSCCCGGRAPHGARERRGGIAAAWRRQLATRFGGGRRGWEALPVTSGSGRSKRGARRGGGGGGPAMAARGGGFMRVAAYDDYGRGCRSAEWRR